MTRPGTCSTGFTPSAASCSRSAAAWAICSTFFGKTAGMSSVLSRITRLADCAREELGLEVIQGILETAGLPDASFDVVLLNHVIEHLDDPLQTLTEVNRILKPDGHFVIETPRYDTLMFKLLGRRERSVSCGGHIYFFTTNTLKNLYEAAGFKTVQARLCGPIADRGATPLQRRRHEQEREAQEGIESDRSPPAYPAPNRSDLAGPDHIDSSRVLLVNRTCLRATQNPSRIVR